MPHDHQTRQENHHGAVRLALVVLVPVAVLTIAAMIWLWPSASDEEPWTGPQRFSAEVTKIALEPCPPPGDGTPLPPGAVPTECGKVVARLTDGPERSKEFVTDIPNGPGAPSVAVGDEVVVIYLPDALSGSPYQIIDHQRGTQLWILLLAFALAVVAFGRWRGVTALAGLAVTFAILLLFVVPAILDGRSPLLVAIVGSAAIMLVVLYLTHGFTVPTSMAVLGTLAALTLTGLLSAATTAAANLTGVGSEESSFLTIMFADVNMRGLLLAGILIGSLGVLDDVAVTQAYTVDELARANPTLRFSGLYRAATRVGRAHIASVVNTIVLAYAGASLPLLILIAAGNQPLGEVLTSEFVAQEVVRSVVGTIGLIAAVPITTALAALTARGTAPRLHAPARHRHRRLDVLESAWTPADDDRYDARTGT